MTSHHGSHIEGGKGDMQGLWDMPLETFIGEAAVCQLAHLTPREIIDPIEYPRGEGWNMKSKPGDVRGQEILPDHLDSVQKGDIVLMTSPFLGLESPWLSQRTAKWLICDRQIKMLGLGAPGIEWQFDLKVCSPHNSPIRRMFLGANIPIAHPLVNIEHIRADRVIYFGLPLNFKKFEASFIRAVAFEAPEVS